MLAVNGSLSSILLFSPSSGPEINFSVDDEQSSCTMSTSYDRNTRGRDEAKEKKIHQPFLVREDTIRLFRSYFIIVDVFFFFFLSGRLRARSFDNYKLLLLLLNLSSEYTKKRNKNEKNRIPDRNRKPEVVSMRAGK